MMSGVPPLPGRFNERGDRCRILERGAHDIDPIDDGRPIRSTYAYLEDERRQRRKPSGPTLIAVDTTGSRRGHAAVENSYSGSLCLFVGAGDVGASDYE
jgi:hypothetical protein